MIARDVGNRFLWLLLFFIPFCQFQPTTTQITMAFAGVFSDTSSDSTPDSFLDSSSASGGGDAVDVADVGLSTLVSSLRRPPLPDPELGGAAVATAVGSTSEPKPSVETDATVPAPGLPADSSPNDGGTI